MEIHQKEYFKGNKEIELFNLEEDIQELNNVAGQNPEIVSQIEKILKEDHTASQIERFKIKQLGD